MTVYEGSDTLLRLDRNHAEALGLALRRLRKRLGYTQRNVAVYMDVDRAMISYWETGARVPDAGQLVRLLALLA